MSPVTATLKRLKESGTVPSSLSLPHTHHRMGETVLVFRSVGPQYFVRTRATCSRLMASTVLASAVSRLSWSQLVPGPE